MRNPRKTLLAFCLCAASAFAAPCFAQAVQPAVPDKASPAPTVKPSKAKPPAQLIDINTASEQELSALKGIGDVRAANIIKNRPYKGKDELVQKKIISPAV